MKKKTQENPSTYDHLHHHTLPIPTKSPITRQKREETTKKSVKSSETMVTCSSSNQNKWSLGYLLNALPLTPSHVYTTTSSSSSNGDHGSNSSSPSSFSSVRQCDHEFFTPTHHLASVLWNTSSRKQEQSPKRRSISTIYESTIDHQVYVVQGKKQGNVSDLDTESGHEFRTPGSKERACGWSEEEERASLVYRPKPYQDFLDQVEQQKREVELDALYKAGYTDLLNKLKKKEAYIDSWASMKTSKAELKLDRIERKMDRKKAKAREKMHQKVAEVKMEAERRKYNERESVMKKVTQFCPTSQGQKPSSMSVLCFPWPSPSEKC